MTAYENLARHFARIDSIHGAIEVLYWDLATQMPKGGAATRGEQLAGLNVLEHDLMVDPRVADWLGEASQDKSLGEWEQANVREMTHRWRHATAVPGDLVEAISRAGSACETFWRTARHANDFAGLAPHFQRVIDLVRQKADAKAAALGVSRYDALLDQYEPGVTAGRIDTLFADLADFLPGLIEGVLEKQARGPAIIPLTGTFPVDQQRALGLQVMEVMGFDFNHGRLDVSAHPFCGGTPLDVRLTTRYDEADFVKGLMGVIHETGHALYERGRPLDWMNQPVGQARSMGLHESQSLLMEMQACRSREFLQFVAPRVRQVFGREGEGYSAENLYRIYTQVKRSLIRVDADEVTYPAHVILRYRLEQAFLAGDIEVKDLPGAWNEGMQALVGITPVDDRNGCMQDIHWMDGTFGYFPTYTLGAMTAAQLFDAANRADADILPGIARGDFKPLLAWLRPNVHSLGCRYSSEELITRATGRPLDAGIFKAHLQRRYLEA
ncbi:MAG: carboxypeptidase M32 [bacterium]